jgi:hypothetical protein
MDLLYLQSDAALKRSQTVQADAVGQLLSIPHPR